MYFVYILQSQKDHGYYIGYTSNLDDRLIRHNLGREKSTKARLPFMLVFKKKFDVRGEAMKYEQYLKTLKNKSYLEQIIVKG